MALTITKDLVSKWVALSSVYVILEARGEELSGKVRARSKYFVSETAAQANSDGALKGVDGLTSDFSFDYDRATDGADILGFVSTKVKEYLIDNSDLVDADIVISGV